MLTIERLRRTAKEVPLLAGAGLAGLLVAGAADLIAHLQVSVDGGHVHGFSAFEVAAHVGVLVSMVLILVGVVVDGARHSRVRHRARDKRKGVA